MRWGRESRVNRLPKHSLRVPRCGGNARRGITRPVLRRRNGRNGSVLLALAAMWFVTAELLAQDDLSWKFEPAQVFFVREVVEQDQTVSVTVGEAGPEGNTRSEQKKTKQTTLTRFQVKDVSADGQVELEMTIEAVQDDGGKTTDIGQRIAGSRFSLTVDRSGQVTRFSGYEEFIGRVSKGNVQFARLFQSILSEDTLKKTFGQILTAAPNKPVEEGESWTQQQFLSMGPFGALDVQRTFTHKGITERGGVPTVNLALTGTADYTPPGGEETGLPFTVTDGRLKVEQMQGTGAFDLQRRRISRLDVSLQVSGTLTMKVGRQEALFSIDQTQNSVVTVHDSRPALSAE